MPSIARLIPALGLLALLTMQSGCTVHFPVKPVDVGSDRALAQPGIYYHLPKTVFGLRFPVQYSVMEGGEMAAIIDCTRMPGYPPPAGDFYCDALLDPETLALGPAVVVRRAVPDPAQTYLVLPRSPWYLTMQHKLTNDSSGFASANYSGGTNEAAAVALDIAKSVVKIAAAAAPGLLVFSKDLHSAEKRYIASCGDAEALTAQERRLAKAVEMLISDLRAATPAVSTARVEGLIGSVQTALDCRAAAITKAIGAVQDSIKNSIKGAAQGSLERLHQPWYRAGKTAAGAGQATPHRLAQSVAPRWRDD